MFDFKKYTVPNNLELQDHLESFNYTYGQTGDTPFQFIKLRAIEEISYVLASELVLILQQGRKRFGDYIYSLEGSRIVRISPKIELKNTSNPKVKLGSVRTINVREKPKQGVVYKVE